MSEKRFTCIFSMARCGKTIRIQQEYEKAKADGKKVLLVDKEHRWKRKYWVQKPHLISFIKN